MYPTHRGLSRIQANPKTKSKENLDRFIPNRSAMNFDYARYKLAEGRNDKEIPADKEAYHRQLREVFDLNRTRILEFKNKPSAPVELFPQDYNASVQQLKALKPVKPKRHIPQTPERTLDCPGFLDDYYLNLLDWGCGNVLAIALENTVYLWDASTRSTSELVTVDDDKGPVTSVTWTCDGCYIAVGLNNSEVQLWDPAANRQLRTLTGGHQARVGSVAWNHHILTTGSMDTRIINNDVRVRDHIVGSYQGHDGEVCGLKWSSSGLQLASGGNDNLLHIWDLRAMAPGAHNEWLHRLEHHRAAVKALAWCPFQANMLASGGGGDDGTIKFWNIHTGACLNSVDTGSQLSALLWSTNERELLSSHGFDRNQLTLWKYPSMVKMADLTGHTSGVLSMAQSPDGRRVASVAGDESLRIWDVFGAPQTTKLLREPTHEPFANLNRIR